MVNTSSHTASTSLAPPANKPLATGYVATAVILSALFIAFAADRMWQWVNGTSLTGEQKATAHLETIKSIASLVVMVGGLGALYLTMRRQRTQELQLAHAKAELDHAKQTAAVTAFDAEARRVTDLYAKAVEQLGSEKAPVRLGGMYALERLAQVNPEQRQTVVDVLCACLRMPAAQLDRDLLDQLEQRHINNVLHAQSDGDLTAPESSELIEARQRYELQQQEHEVRRAARRILASHLRPIPDATGEPTNPRYWNGHLRIDLSNAVLVNADFGDCQFAEAVFDHTRFYGETKFAGARFRSTTRFRGASFDEVDFSNARFERQAVFTAAKFHGKPSFRGAVITRADFSSAAFYDSVVFAGVRFLKTASFHRTTFQGPAGFVRATFEGGAGFSEVSFTKEALFREVAFGDTTGFFGTKFHDNVRVLAAAHPEHLDLDGATAMVQPYDAASPRDWPAGWTLGPSVADEYDEEEFWSPLIRVVDLSLASGDALNVDAEADTGGSSGV